MPRRHGGVRFAPLRVASRTWQPMRRAPRRNRRQRTMTRIHQHQAPSFFVPFAANTTTLEQAPQNRLVRPHVVPCFAQTWAAARVRLHALSILARAASRACEWPPCVHRSRPGSMRFRCARGQGRAVSHRSSRAAPAVRGAGATLRRAEPHSVATAHRVDSTLTEGARWPFRCGRAAGSVRSSRHPSLLPAGTGPASGHPGRSLTLRSAVACRARSARRRPAVPRRSGCAPPAASRPARTASSGIAVPSPPRRCTASDRP